MSSSLGTDLPSPYLVQTLSWVPAGQWDKLQTHTAHPELKCSSVHPDPGSGCHSPVPCLCCFPWELSGGCWSHVVTQVSGSAARSDVCSEMRLAMMPLVLTNGLSLISDSWQQRGQQWKKPMRSLAASLPRDLHTTYTLNLSARGGLIPRDGRGLFSNMPALSCCVCVQVHGTTPDELQSSP